MERRAATPRMVHEQSDEDEPRRANATWNGNESGDEDDGDVLPNFEYQVGTIPHGWPVIPRNITFDDGSLWFEEVRSPDFQLPTEVLTAVAFTFVAMIITTLSNNS